MAATASLAKFNQLQNKLQIAQKKIARVKEQADDKVSGIVNMLVSGTETAGAALALSTAKGYYGKAADVGGIPLELTAAIVFHGLGIFGVGGKDTAKHLHNFGNGALAAAAAGFGREVGMNWSSEKDFGKAFMKSLPVGDSTRAVASTSAGQRLTESELEALTKG